MTLNCTPEQEKAIEELRNQIKDELPYELYEDKIFIYKFLKARNFNLKQSKAMLRKHLQFRKQIQLDTIIKDFKVKEVQKKYIPQCSLGFDKDGSPVRYVAMGKVDYKGLLKSSNGDELITFVMRLFEIDNLTYKQQSKKLGRDVFQTLFIWDMDKFTFSQATQKESVQHLMKGLIVFQDNFPETLKRVYFINASQYFTMVFSVVKTILAATILDKIRVFGQSGYKEELLKVIDAEVLPAFLGGKRTDPDGNPLCLTFVNHGGMVPERLHLIKNIERTARKPGMKCIKLERQARTTIPINVEKPTSIINWEFEVKCYDIGFGLTRDVNDEENPEEIIPVYKVETELESTTGMYRCKKIGTYNLVFDNSYSWFHQKEVYYRAWVTDETYAINSKVQFI